MSAKAMTPARARLRAAQIGVALGVAGFILTTLLVFQILFAWDPPPGSVIAPILGRFVVQQLGMLLVAPALAFGAGLLLDAKRWSVAVAMVAFMQGASACVRVASVGFAAYRDVVELFLLFGGGAAGVALSAWAMRRAQQLMKARTARAQMVTPLAQIDFEALKKAEEGSAEKRPEGEGK